MSTTARSKEIVQEYFNAIIAGDMQGAFAYIDPSCRFVLPGKSPLAGSRSPEEMAAIMGPMMELMKDFTYEVVGITAEGNRVAVETRGHAKLPNGSVYANEYHFLFELNDAGKIVVSKEYMCSYHAMEALGPVLASIMPAEGAAASA